MKRHDPDMDPRRVELQGVGVEGQGLENAGNSPRKASPGPEASSKGSKDGTRRRWPNLESSQNATSFFLLVGSLKYH